MIAEAIAACTSDILQICVPRQNHCSIGTNCLAKETAVPMRLGCYVLPRQRPVFATMQRRRWHDCSGGTACRSLLLKCRILRDHFAALAATLNIGVSYGVTVGIKGAVPHTGPERGPSFQSPPPNTSFPRRAHLPHPVSRLLTGSALYPSHWCASVTLATVPVFLYVTIGGRMLTPIMECGYFSSYRVF